ncbi:MAG: cytochrome c biogenesis protein CcdA, partial [Planctomycetota bacterium]
MRTSVVSTLCLALLAWLCFAPPAAAQDDFVYPVHVSANLPTEAVPAGGTFEVSFDVRVDDTYHIYSHDSEGGVLPTEMFVEMGEHYALVELDYGDAGHEVFDKVIGETYTVLEGLFTFRAVFRVKPEHPPGPGGVEVTVAYQACDANSCLFPEESVFDVPIEVRAARPGDDLGAAVSQAGDLFSGKTGTETSPFDIDSPFGNARSTSSARDEFVYPVHVSLNPPSGPVPAGGAFEATFDIRVDETFHVYAHDSAGGVQPTEMFVDLGDRFDLVEIDYGDAGHEIFDEVLGERYTVLEGLFGYRAVLRVRPDTPPGPTSVEITLSYMACDDRACLLQKDDVFEVPVEVRAARPGEDLDAVVPAMAGMVSDIGGGAPRSSGGASMDSVQDEFRAALASGNVASFLWLTVILALLSLLTPCVFPMIPITVSFFAKRGESEGSRGASYALAYGLGIVGTYTAFGLGMAFLLGASSLQTFATHPWTNLGIAAIFVFFGLSLMGFYELKPPAFLTRKAEAGAAGVARAGYTPVIVMGFVFTITAFTCTAPIVGALLAALTTGGSKILIVLGMVVYSVVFALPFVLLALFPRVISSLPRAGGWMVTLKVALGFAELVAALKFFSNADLVWDLQLMPRPVMLLMTIGLVAALAMFLFGTYRLPHDASGPSKLFSMRTLLAVAVALASLYLARGMTGQSLDPWTESYLPPHEYGMPAGTESHDGIAWIDDYEAGMAESRASGRNAFLDFTGITCINCRKVEKQFFADPRFGAAVERLVVPVRLYTDRRSAEYKQGDAANRKLMEELGSVTLPLYVLMSPDGQILKTMGYSPDFSI